jgi:hypothetical protein
MDTVIKADAGEDENHVRSIWQDNLPDSSVERFRSIYRDNPYGPSWVWLAAEEDESGYIGTTGLCQRRVVVSGETVPAGVAIDFAILKENRGFGPALKLQREVTTGLTDLGLEFIYAFPNKNAVAVFKRVRYKEIGKMTRWVKVLRSHYKLKNVLKSEILSKTVSPLVDSVINKTMKERTFKSPMGTEIKILGSFDSRFATLWQKANGQFKVIGERTPEFLKLRYERFMNKKSGVFCITNDSGETIHGYVVYTIKDNMCHVTDLLTMDLESGLDTLFSEFITHMRKQGPSALSLSYLGSSAVVNKLKEWGFVQREEERSIMVFINQGHQQAQVILDKDNWHLLEGDDV